VKKVQVKTKKELERLGFIYEGQIKEQMGIMNKSGEFIYDEVIGKIIEVNQAPKNTGYDYQYNDSYFVKRWLHLHLDEVTKKDSKNVR
jgi:hypothetical protein